MTHLALGWLLCFHICAGIICTALFLHYLTWFLLNSHAEAADSEPQTEIC